MKKFFFLLIPLFAISCATEQTNEESINDTTKVVVQPAKDSLALSESFITGNWKLVWIAGDSLKITPKMRAKLAKAIVFFKFNADKSFFFIKNDKTTKGTWSLNGNEICIHLETSKKDRCTTIKVIDPDQISFFFEYSQKIKADIILSRVPK